jgi:hypothetical protein
MLPPQRRSKVFGIGAMLLGLLAGLYLIVSKSFKKPGKAKDIRHHKQATSADDALKYWTADKMRHANALELPHVDPLERGKPQPPRQA